MPLAFERALRRPSPRALATHPAALAGNALTDGRLKYIYRAWRGDEQLFNLSADPTESRDLAGAPAYTAVLADWRRRMVAQFEREGRGPEWVMEGKLVVREQGQTYGPNFPQAPPPRPGDRIVMRPNGGGVDCNTNDCWLLVDSASGTALKLIGTATSLPVSLCLSASAAAAAASASAGAAAASASAGGAATNLTVDVCRAGAKEQLFATSHSSVGTATRPLARPGEHPGERPGERSGERLLSGTAATPMPMPSMRPERNSTTTATLRVTHIPSGRCVTAGDASTAALQPCAAAGSSAAQRQLWLFGASGRLCATLYNNLCLHVDAQWPEWWQMPRP